MQASKHWLRRSITANKSSVFDMFVQNTPVGRELFPQLKNVGGEVTIDRKGVKA